MPDPVPPLTEEALQAIADRWTKFAVRDVAIWNPLRSPDQLTEFLEAYTHDVPALLREIDRLWGRPRPTPDPAPPPPPPPTRRTPPPR